METTVADGMAPVRINSLPKSPLIPKARTKKNIRMDSANVLKDVELRNSSANREVFGYAAGARPIVENPKSMVIPFAIKTEEDIQTNLLKN